MVFFSKIIIIALLLLLFSVITGLILHRKGHPYPFILSNFHKLLSVGTIVFVVIEMVNLLQGKEAQITGITITGLTGLTVLLSLISGGLLARKTESGIHLQKIHRISSLLSILLIALCLTWHYTH
jgi:hypothetical protein